VFIRDAEVRDRRGGLRAPRLSAFAIEETSRLNGTVDSPSIFISVCSFFDTWRISTTRQWFDWRV
jgi:hypothetical protein